MTNDTPQWKNVMYDSSITDKHVSFSLFGPDALKLLQGVLYGPEMA